MYDTDMKELKEYTYLFSRNNKAIARAKQGEAVIFHTLDCFGGQIRSEDDKVENLDFSKANPATGPLYIEGAMPGDVLAVDILDVKVADQGIMATVNGLGALSRNCEARTKILKVEDGWISFNDIRFPAKPMIGVIGVAPAGGDVRTSDSSSCGGNMDSRIITKGVTVYLPVAVEGALLAMGDVHAAMGDGEVCETGVEIGASITVKARVIPQFDLRWPITETEEFWFVNTTGKDCDTAIRYGYEEMQRLVMNAYGWDGTDACFYLSAQARVESNQACLNQHEKDEEGDTFRVGVPKLGNKPPLIPQK